MHAIRMYLHKTSMYTGNICGCVEMERSIYHECKRQSVCRIGRPADNESSPPMSFRREMLWIFEYSTLNAFPFGRPDYQTHLLCNCIRHMCTDLDSWHCSGIGTLFVGDTIMDENKS